MKGMVNMEKLTIGQIAMSLVFLLSIIGNIKSLIKTIKEPIDKKLAKVLEPVYGKIDGLEEKIDNMEKEHMKKLSKLELESTRNDLVNYMSLADKGIVTPKTKEDMHVLYDEYRKHGGNSYIHDEWERLKKEGKI